MDDETFRYRPTCSVRGCEQSARYKVAAPWTDGTRRELKNYGLACEAHRDAQRDLARDRRARLNLAEGEAVGEVALFRLIPGALDAELLKA